MRFTETASVFSGQHDAARHGVVDDDSGGIGVREPATKWTDDAPCRLSRPLNVCNSGYKCAAATLTCGMTAARCWTTTGRHG